jgi:type VI protein secretion system component Hcp
MRDADGSSEHEDVAEVEDLEVKPEEAAEVAGGLPAVQFQDISITKTTDQSSPKL